MDLGISQQGGPAIKLVINYTLQVHQEDSSTTFDKREVAECLRHVKVSPPLLLRQSLGHRLGHVLLVRVAAVWVAGGVAVVLKDPFVVPLDIS